MADQSPEALRIKYGAWLIGVSFVVLGLVFAVAIWQYDKASADVVAVVGAFTGVIGTVIGAFFGVQVGSAGKEAAENRSAEAQSAALMFAALAPDTEETREIISGLHKSLLPRSP